MLPFRSCTLLVKFAYFSSDALSLRTSRSAQTKRHESCKIIVTNYQRDDSRAEGYFARDVSRSEARFASKYRRDVRVSTRKRKFSKTQSENECIGTCYLNVNFWNENLEETN